MSSFEDELKRFEPVIKAMVRLALFGKKIVVRGEEHFVRAGPNLIVGNHCGSFKDVATIFRTVPRQVFFAANKQIFTKDELDFLVKKHLKRHLKNFGGFLNFLLNPFKSLFVLYVSSNIAKIGTIPVDLINQGKREAILRCQEYLRDGRAIIALQGRGRVVPQDPNPYVRPFGRGTSVIAYNMHERYGMAVPVTPLAMYGTQLPFLIPGKVHVNVGKPMFITDYLASGFGETVSRFKQALESTVHKLFFELINP
jgi:1-acyl-sn-glycerol-3-phosphate acyltransferase